jgi:hypothetical protein
MNVSGSENHVRGSKLYFRAVIIVCGSRKNVCGTPTNVRALKKKSAGLQKNVRTLKLMLGALKYIIFKSQLSSGVIEKVSGIFTQSDRHSQGIYNYGVTNCSLLQE